MLFENFAFAADYQGYTGHVRYQTQAEGELWVPQSESLLNALNQLKGKFRVEFSDLNEAGRRSIESLGSEYVSSQGTLLVSDVIISEGNLLLNGKDYR